MTLDTPVLIPAYNPPKELVGLVEELLRLGIPTVVVINDGSAQTSGHIFEALQKMSNVRCLSHPANLGKGAALKTGLRFIGEYHPQSVGVVTADADGQHSADDIIKVAKALVEHPSSLVLGCRRISRDIPWRSWFGNALTRKVFFWLTGRKLSDTQSGLRGLPLRYVREWRDLPGRGYEYEMNLLLSAAQSKVDIIEEPITTLYIAGNLSSHFHPLLDSMRIYFVLLRYVLSSLLAAAVDLLFFSIIIQLIPNITISVLISRFVIGALVNFTINRSLVFRSPRPIWVTLVQYYIVAVTSGLLASIIIIQLTYGMGLPVLLGKVIAETLLFPLGFMLQKKWVFATPKET